MAAFTSLIADADWSAWPPKPFTGIRLHEIQFTASRRTSNHQRCPSGRAFSQAGGAHDSPGAGGRIDAKR